MLQTINQGVGGVGNLLQIATFQIAATLFEMVSSPPACPIPNPNPDPDPSPTPNQVLTSLVLVRLGVPSISLCVIGGAALYRQARLVAQFVRKQ